MPLKTLKTIVGDRDAQAGCYELPTAGSEGDVLYYELVADTAQSLTLPEGTEVVITRASVSEVYMTLTDTTTSTAPTFPSASADDSEWIPLFAGFFLPSGDAEQKKLWLYCPKAAVVDVVCYQSQ